MSNLNENLENFKSPANGALTMAAKGFRVFPCKSNAKEPACRWQEEATTDPSIIREWSASSTEFNYGVALDDRHFVLDLDCKGGRDGKRDLETLELCNNDLPSTLVVETPSGGFHIYLAGGARNSVGKKEFGGGIDVRGQGGYVLGPDSVIDGKRYQVASDAPIAEAPAWLLEMTARRDAAPAKRNPTIPLDAPHEVHRMRTHLQSLVDQGDVAIEFCGGNNRTYELFGELMDYVSPERACALVAEIWNPACSPPWSDAELQATCANAAKYRQNDIGAKATQSPAQAFKDYKPETSAKQTDDGFKNIDGLSYRSMKDIRPLEFVWLWPERIAVGKLTLIAGAPDGGKSQIAAYMAATVSNGGAWPFNEGVAEKAAVLWFSAEDTAADTTVPRLIAAGANMDLVFEVRSVVDTETGSRTLSLAKDLSKIEGAVKQIESEYGFPVKLIVIDPISAYMGGRTEGDTWKNGDVRNIMTPLVELVGKVGISTIGITHFKKGRDADVLNRVIDSIALPALSRATWLVAPEKDEEGNPSGRRLFLTGKKNIGRPVPGLAYRIVEKMIDNQRGGSMPAPRVEWAGVVAASADDALSEQGSARAGKLERAKDFLGCILLDGALSVKDIRKKAGERHSWRTIEMAKKALGIVSDKRAFDGEWFWMLPGHDVTEVSEDPDAELFRVAAVRNPQEGRRAN